LIQYRWLIIVIICCLVFAIVGYFWATGLIDSVFSYRSPLQYTPPTTGEPLGAPLTNRVVIVLIDALRYDTSINSNVMPFLNTLRKNAASARMHSKPPSYSEPGYTTLLTGAWPDINDGPAVNLDYPEIPMFTQDDIFSAAHRIGLHTAISGYYWFEKLVPQNAVDESFYTPGEDAAADKVVIAAANKMLAGDFQLFLIHIDQVDYAGHHQGGPFDQRWNVAAKQADDYLSQIVSALDLARDTVIVVSDHGQIDRGGHGGPEPITLLEPFVMAGAGVRPGKSFPDISQVDVAPTIAALLGTNFPASAEGRVRTEMLNLTREYESIIQIAEVEQKKLLYDAYTSAINSQPSTQPDPSSPFSYVIGMDSARANRLAGERVWRNITAIILAFLCAYGLIIIWKRKMLWLALGGVIYIFIFNFRYALIDGHTYSLSSVEGQTWLLTYTAITATIALVIAWLVVMPRLHAFQAGQRKAAETSLGLVFSTLFLLALPILVNFALNGTLVSWTLPEFYTSYIALLSLLQWIFVSAVGLLLTGTASLVSNYVPHSTRMYEKTRRKYDK
jgi:hypothetical protein